MEELKQKLIQIIQEVYRKIYIGKLQVERLNPVGLVVKLGLNIDEKPITIAADLEDEPFLDFFRREVREKRLNETKYFIGDQLLPYDECSLPKGCSNRCNSEPYIPSTPSARQQESYNMPSPPKQEPYYPPSSQSSQQQQTSPIPLHYLAEYATMKWVKQYIDEYIDLTEEDPVFCDSPAYNITTEDILNWNSKSTFSGSYLDLQDIPELPVASSNILGMVKIGEGLEINPETGLLTVINNTNTVEWTNVVNHPEIPTRLSQLASDEDHNVVTNTDISNWNDKMSVIVHENLEQIEFFK